MARGAASQNPTTDAGGHALPACRTENGRLAGRLAPLDLGLERRVQFAVRSAISAGLVTAAHDCAEGGLAVALAEGAVTGPTLVGCDVEAPGGTYDYYAEVVGPGGAVLVSSGSRDVPHHVGGAIPLASGPGDAGGNDDAIYWAIGGAAGGVVVVAVVIGLAVGLGTPSDQTAFGPPMLRMP